MSKRALVVAVAAVALAAGSAALGAGATALLPPSGAVDGWQRSGPTVTYVPSNLYQYIDGAADGYLVFDFRLLGHAEYVNPAVEGQKIVVDVYEMATPEDAFGIYSVERSPEVKFLPLGDQGYATARSVTFHQNRFYVRIQARRPGSAAQEAMLALARAVSKLAPRGTGQPRMLRIFPRPSRIVNSERYVRGAVLGHEFLPRGYMADYEEGENRVRLVAIDWPRAEDAAEAVAKLAEFIGEERLRKVDGLGDAAFDARDKYLGRMLVFREGRLLGAVVGFSELRWAESRARMMLQRWRQWWGEK